MKAYVITLESNAESFTAADRLIDSSNHFGNEFTIQKYRASEPNDVASGFFNRGIKWNYPWTKEFMDMQSGLLKTPYETEDPKKRMACFLSHWLLWYKCAEIDEPLLIFEHDAIFIRKLQLSLVTDSPYEIVSLNDPRGATRKGQRYHELIAGENVTQVPWIDVYNVPQGLPGNSAYYITPKGAKKILEVVKEYGAWPNDAIMCKQLMPKMLGCLGWYATSIQRNIESTTTK